METLTFNLPTLYGDHHVTEVRRLLLAIPGVKDIYASSSFQVLEVQYDPSQVKAEAIETALSDAGYLDEMDITSEASEAVYGREANSGAFRHTMAFEQTREMVSFGHNVHYSGRPLWPCPGMGPVRKVDNGDNGNG